MLLPMEYRGNYADRSADQSGWVTTRVAAEALGVDPRTVRKYINRGELNAKVEGEGVEKAYLVSIDSVYSLRDQMGGPRAVRDRIRAKSASGLAADQEWPPEAREALDRAYDLERHLGRLEGRLELTERAESTLREQLQRERDRADAEKARAERSDSEARELREKLEDAQQSWWRRLFRG
jgi:hypothetical protein